MLDDGNVLTVAYDYYDRTTAYNGQPTTVFHRVVFYHYNADEYKYVLSQTIEWDAAYPSSVTMDMNGRGDRIVLGDRYQYTENQRDGLVRIYVRQSSSNGWVLSCNFEGTDQEYQGHVGGRVKMNSEGDVVAFLINYSGSSSKVEVHSLDRETGDCGPEIGSGVTLRYRGSDWDGTIFDIDAEGSTIIVGDSGTCDSGYSQEDWEEFYAHDETHFSLIPLLQTVTLTPIQERFRFGISSPKTETGINLGRLSRKASFAKRTPNSRPTS